MSHVDAVKNSSFDITGLSASRDLCGFITEDALDDFDDIVSSISLLESYLSCVITRDVPITLDENDLSGLLRVILRDCQRIQGELPGKGNSIFSEREARTGLAIVKQFGLKEAIRIVQQVKQNNAE